MKNKSLFTLFLLSLLFVSCSQKEKFALSKPYWTPEDYRSAIWEIEHNMEKEEKKPCIDDPKYSNVFKKIVNHDNYLVVLDDNELGITFKNEVASDFFSIINNLTKLYSERDRQDKFIYGKELVKVYHFSLGLQAYYFKLGNENIKKNASNPDNSEVISTINRNVRTLFENYALYLDLMNREDSFDEASISLLCEGIDTYFINLVNAYPDKNFNWLISKVASMSEKSKSQAVKTTMSNLIQHIASVQTK